MARSTARGVFIALAIFLAPSAALSAEPEPQSSSEEAVDLMKALGIDVPEGEALDRLTEEAARHPLGSKDNPVRASGPGGQRAYLARLRCANGQPPKFRRTVNAGIGPFGRIIDAYDVTCGAERHEVFLDMYHDHVETHPIPGFTIATPTREPTA